MSNIKLEEPEKSDDGLLSKLLQDVLINTGRLNTISTDIQKYVKNGGKKAPTSIMGHVKGKTLTWKALLFVLFKVMKYKKLTLKVTLLDEDNKESVHTLIATSTDTTIRKATTKEERLEALASNITEIEIDNNDIK